jgi:hypothetical protein
VDEGPALGLVAPGDVHAQPQRLELIVSAVAELVVAERGVEAGPFACQARERDRRDRPATPGSGEDLARVDDLAGSGHPLHLGELDPLDMAHGSDTHGGGVSQPAPPSARPPAR